MSTQNVSQPASGLAGKSFRPDIQGLRALAVVLVLVFHIWPAALPGGYVGVDVFFVISGYLITGILLRQAVHKGEIGFLAFYARRARRLLPAATAVLVAVVIASFLWMPELHWHETAQDVLASALYAMNWWLAASAGDYFAADAAVSPLRHYWSLAIEEQFYLLWPAVVALLVGLARRFRWRMVPTLTGGILAVIIISFVHSGIATADHRAWAYFATTTRAWELAVGGLLALALPASGSRWNPAIAAAGLLAILIAAFLFDGNSAFPGWIAMLPVAGTAAVIYSGGATGANTFIHRLLGSAIPRYLGGTSYSLYLWHWPLIVFAAHVTGSQPGPYSGALLILASLVFADLSKRLIEDPIYRSNRHDVSPRNGLFIGATCVVAAALAGLALLVLPSAGGVSDDQAIVANKYPGAAVMSYGYVHDHTPSLAHIRRDIPQDYRKCHGSPRAVRINPCPPVGPADATIDIAVVGDSHAGQWTPALFDLAARIGARVHIYTKSSCPFTLAQILEKGSVYAECSQWNQNLLEVLRTTRPDIIFSSASSRYDARDGDGLSDASAIAAGQRVLWRELDAMGAQIVVMRDTPRPARVRVDPAQCLAQANARPADCSIARAKVVTPELEDPNLLSAQGASFVHTLDLTDHICNAAACDPVVGNVVVWRDNNHITATYAKTLAGALHQALLPILPGAGTDREATITEATPGTSLAMEGMLDCGPSGQHAPFDRAISLTVSGTELHVLRGDWQQRNRGYEIWKGEMSADGHITVTGHYREGGPDIKKVELNGRKINGKIELTGRRGPRECRFVAALP